MCLTVPIGRFKIQIATRPIAVYKILVKYDYNFIGPYRRKSKYRSGRTYRPKCDKFGIDVIAQSFGTLIRDARVRVHEGIHSYATFRKAAERVYHDCEIIKMYIPKGSAYVKYGGGVVSNALYFPRNSEDIPC